MPSISGGAQVQSSAQIADGVIVDADIDEAAAIALSKLATDPLARANHTGTQPASTISDFAAAVAANEGPNPEAIMFIVAADVGASSNITFDIGAAGFADGVNGVLSCLGRVPAAADGLGISAIKVLYLNEDGGSAKVVRIKLRAIHYDNSDGGVRTDDSTETEHDYTTNGSSNSTGIFTLNGVNYDGLPATMGTGDILEFRLTRAGAHANDTYATVWKMMGLLIEFA